MYTVECPAGNPVGVVVRKWNTFRLTFDIYSSNKLRFKVRGPGYPDWHCRSFMHCLFSQHSIYPYMYDTITSFSVIDVQNSNRIVGTIIKVWSLARSECDARFGIDLPPEMDVSLKAEIIASTFLINHFCFNPVCCRNQED